MGQNALMNKSCSVCFEIKEIESFYNSSSSKDGKSYRCKSCDNAARRKWRTRNATRAKRSARERQLRYKYQLTTDAYNDLLKSQDNKCAICLCEQNSSAYGVNISEHFAIDHDHRTGKVRGLLCNTCNRALGMFKDDVGTVSRALNYLSNYQETH